MKRRNCFIVTLLFLSNFIFPSARSALIKNDTTIPVVIGRDMITLKHSVNRPLIINDIIGALKDNSDRPIAGVTVRIKGSTVGTLTNNNGEFKLTIKDTDTLVFSTFGYSAVEVKASLLTNYANPDFKINSRIERKVFNSITHDERQLDVFPLPYPTPSGIYNLKSRLFQNLKTLHDVDSLICRALDKCKYDEKRYYYAPHGFALITEMEQTFETGQSMDPPDRWSIRVANKLNNPLNYFKALFFVPKGYFRVFVFLVTDINANASNVQISEEDARKWLDKGYQDLPREIRGLPLNDFYNYSILVYQYKKNVGSEADLIHNFTAAENFHWSHLDTYLIPID